MGAAKSRHRLNPQGVCTWGFGGAFDCMTMGTASTMTAIAEALGLTLPGASSIPAADSNHIRMATACGRRIVEMVNEDVRPEHIVDRRAVDHVLVLRGAVPQGGPGMPEWGMLPIPRVLLKQGVRDMLRVFDARMSGTSYGGCVLHVAPEAHVGGPLALVRTGDRIRVSVSKRSIDMLVGDAEVARRRSEWTAPEPRFERGYGWMFAKHIRQANEGCDFDFLETGFGAPVAEPEIY